MRSSLILILLCACYHDTADNGHTGTTDETGETAPPGCDEGATAVFAGLEMADICAGSFEMGCTEGQQELCDYNEPLHPVTLTHGYWMKVTEVTQDEFAEVTGLTPSYFECGGSCPVENVTWHMAAAYANALSSLEGLEACYSCEGEGEGVTCSPAGDPYECEGFRLPTDAEWEKAARCGQDLLFAGSDTIEEVGWTSETADGTPHPVASLAPNRCGLYDMSGNLGEWIHDARTDYAESEEVVDPAGGEFERHRTLRPGSFGDRKNSSRNASRGSQEPGVDNGSSGIRIVLTQQ